MYHSSAIIIPAGAKRILVFANTEGRVPSGFVRAGDLCIHINKARHKSEVMSIPGTWHELVVRHGNARNGVKPTWHTPDDMTGFCCVHFTPTVKGWSCSEWWKEYKRKCGKCPTSGFIVYTAVKEAVEDSGRNMQVLLMGFDPAHDCGSYRADVHGWEYEASVYNAEKAVRVPFIK